MSEFNYDKFSQQEREKYLIRERNETVKRHLENDFFGAPQGDLFYKPRGFFHSVRFALLILPLWILFVWIMAVLVGYPTGAMPASHEFKIQWVYWILMTFLVMSGFIVFIYSYKFWRNGKLKLFRIVIGLLVAGILSLIAGAIIAFLISNS